MNESGRLRHAGQSSPALNIDADVTIDDVRAEEFAGY
jgi:hypothetical protein